MGCKSRSGRARALELATGLASTSGLETGLGCMSARAYA